MNFVHYTKKIEYLQGILANGLLLNPLKRNVMHLFSSSYHFNGREPQQFGLSSLRREGVIGSRRHTIEFGDYGIVFKNEWVKSKGFRKVVYIKENSRYHNTLKKFFDDAEAELLAIIKERPPDDAFPYMGYTNRNVASLLGAHKYSHFLSVYEVLEPYKNKWQKEWRAVQQDPLCNTGTTNDFVKRISRPGWDNLTMTLKFQADDVSHFVTRLSKRKQLKEALPKEYKCKEVRLKIFS